jgi:hypothetical protein
MIEGFFGLAVQKLHAITKKRTGEHTAVSVERKTKATMAAYTEAGTRCSYSDEVSICRSDASGVITPSVIVSLRRAAAVVAASGGHRRDRSCMCMHVSLWKYFARGVVGACVRI